MATLILTCSTGQGHNSCAHAIKEFYDLQNEVCVIEDALSFVSPAVSKIICWGHTTMYRHFHSLFQIGYGYSEKHPGMFQEQSWIYKLLTLGVERIYEYIRSGGFDTVICTHVFASLMITEVRKKHILPIVTGLVATDYTCNPGTKESTVDLNFIPDLPLSVSYECPTIADEQIISSGIPIRQMFYHNTEKNEAKKQFGIPSDHSHLLMMCGSMGCGPMKKLTRQLSKQLPDNMDLSIVCGTNKALQKSLLHKYGSIRGIHILGYVQNMSALMDSADLCLTKPGGISITEAAVKNLPMVFIDAVAGCEEYNKIYFIRKGAAKTAVTVREITNICINLLSNPGSLEKMRQNLISSEKRNAPHTIYTSLKALRVCHSGDSAFQSHLTPENTASVANEELEVASAVVTSD